MTRMIIVVEVPETLQEDAVRGLFEFVKCEVVSIDRAAELPLERNTPIQSGGWYCKNCNWLNGDEWKECPNCAHPRSS